MPQEVESEGPALHADLDSFFLSVEAALDSRLRGVPAVCAGESVVVSASYQAREKGVHAGMPTAHAVRKVPGLRVVQARIDAYRAVSRELFAAVEPMAGGYKRLSIDEAAWVSGGSLEIAETMRGTAWERYRLPMSVGVAPTTLLAKLACSAAKPNGAFEVPPGSAEEFILELPARALPGVGPVTAQKLETAGVHTVRDLRALSGDRAVMLLGDAGARTVRMLASGHFPERGEPKSETSGAERTVRQAVSGQPFRDVFDGVLASAIHRVAGKGRPVRSVTVTVRSRSGQSHSTSRSLDFPTLDTTSLIAAAEAAWSSVSHLTVTLVRVSFALARESEQLALDLPLPGLSVGLPALQAATVRDVAFYGMRVTHGVFGEGFVRGLRGDSIAVEFRDRMRILDVDVAPLSWLENETAPTP